MQVPYNSYLRLFSFNESRFSRILADAGRFLLVFRPATLQYFRRFAILQPSRVAKWKRGQTHLVQRTPGAVLAGAPVPFLAFRTVLAVLNNPVAQCFITARILLNQPD